MVSSKTRTSVSRKEVGLALCKRVFEMHRREIEADSKDCQTIFTFIVPTKFSNEYKMLSEEMLEVARNLLKEGVIIKLISKAISMKEN